MAFVPNRLSQRLTLGCIVLLILTALAVFAVMALRGQPRVVAASGELIEQTGSAIVRQLALQLARIEGVTASLAHVAEVLPREEPLYLNSLPNMIDSQGDKAIAGVGGGPEPNAVTGVPMVTCSVPYQLEGRFAGVATLDLLLDDLARFLTEQGKVTDGYAFALDQSGNVLHFPNMIGAKGGTMVKFADMAQQHSWLKPVQEALNSSSSGAIRNLDLENDEQLKQASRVSLFVMPDTGWVIGLATPQKRVTGLARALTWEILLFLLPLLAVLLALAWLAGRKLIGQLEETTAQIDSLGRGSANHDVELS